MNHLFSILVAVFFVSACDVVINIQQQEPTQTVEAVAVPAPTVVGGSVFNTFGLPDPEPGFHWKKASPMGCLVYGCDKRTCEIENPKWRQVKDYDFEEILSATGFLRIRGAPVEKLIIYSNGNIGL